MLKKLKKYQFLFEELVKRDFKKKYKRTILGMAWSVLSPLLSLLVMWVIFGHFFQFEIPHFVIYLFAGNIVYSFFCDSTNQGMSSLVGNAEIFTKVNVPKYMFLLSQNVSAIINFGLTLVLFFVFVAFDDVSMFSWKFIYLLYPIVCLTLFNLGCGLLLSALYVFFKDIQYLWGVFIQLLMYLSAIFYSIDSYSQTIQYLFLCNPIYLYISYFRMIVIESAVPTVWFHLGCAFYAIVMLWVGCWMYKENNHRFLYYV